MAPHTPQRSERPGEAVSLLGITRDWVADITFDTSSTPHPFLARGESLARGVVSKGSG